jgi:methylglutaconyl-CoA hydratase
LRSAPCREPLDIAIDASGAARFTLNRPKKGNSVDLELAEALALARRCGGHEVARLSSSPEAGGTSPAASTFPDARRRRFEETNYEDAPVAKLLHRLYTPPVRTVAAVPGRAIGLGVGLVAACDIAIAVDPQARFSEVSICLQ